MIVSRARPHRALTPKKFLRWWLDKKRAERTQDDKWGQAVEALQPPAGGESGEA